MFLTIARLFKETLVYGLGSSGNQLVAFALLPVYTRFLSPADFGVLALVGLLGQALFPLMAVGQGAGLFRRYLLHEDAGDREVVLSTAFWVAVGLSLPVAMVALALSRPLASLLTGSADYASWVALGVGGVALRTLLRMPYAALRARSAAWWYAAASFAETAGAAALTVALVVGLSLGGRGVLLGQLGAELLLAAVLLPAVLAGGALRFSRDEARHLLGHGALQVPSRLLGLLLRTSDRYFLKTYGTLEAVGLYALGYRFGEVLGFAMAAFNLAWGPFLFAQRASPEAPALYARVTTYYVAALGGLWLAVSLLAPEVIAVMAHPAFHEAHRVVPWIAAAMAVQGLAHIGNVGIALHRRAEYRPAILAVAAAANLALNWVLVPEHGMMGAAVAALVSSLLWLALQVTLAQRLYAVPYEHARLVRLVLLVAVLYTAGWIWPWASIWGAMLGKALLVASLPLLLWVSGFLEAGELRRLRAAATRARPSSAAPSDAGE